MIRVLILSDDFSFGSNLVSILQQNKEFSYEATLVVPETAAYNAILQAEIPFDIILIDQHLDSDLDGIEVLKQLRSLSPESEALVFTVAGDESAGIRAYHAGAYSYLPKPFRTEEFLLILKSLCTWQDTRNERDVLKIFAEITAAAQKLLPLQDMSQIIVESGQRFGFERARLWLLDDQGENLVGLNQLGNQGLEQFKGFQIPVSESIYVRRAIAGREPYILHGQEFGLSYLTQAFGSQGFQLAEGDWAALPLWAGDRCIGLLLLDNYSQPRHISVEQQQQLALFANLVAAALERAKLMGITPTRLHSTIEAVAIEGLENYVDVLPVEALPDADVLALSHMQLNFEYEEELSHLLVQNQEGELTDAGRVRLNQLMDMYKRLSLRKAEALRVAVERGLRPSLS